MTGFILRLIAQIVICFVGLEAWYVADTLLTMPDDFAVLVGVVVFGITILMFVWFTILVWRSVWKRFVEKYSL